MLVGHRAKKLSVRDEQRTDVTAEKGRRKERSVCKPRKSENFVAN